MIWTHVICWTCWDEKNPGRLPVRLVKQGMSLKKETCCFCGTKTEARIYVRENPKNVKFCKCKE